MAPARIEEDPVIAEYDIYINDPPQNDQIYLLQYPNRPRDRPYNQRLGAVPREVRIKPHAGHLELDVKLNTQHNFNKYRSLKWGDALKTGREVQNASATYGQAAGFIGLRGGVGGQIRRVQLRDDVDRHDGIDSSLNDFENAEEEGKVMRKQTLGGQIIRHDTAEEAGKPTYYIGAFRGPELHLTKLSGTVQMRPQFHHLDAEDQRGRIAHSRAAAQASAAAAAAADGHEGGSGGHDVARLVHQSYKATTLNPKGELEQREYEMKMALQTAHEELWTKMEYVDEDADEAYRAWNERMFVQDTSEEAGCVKLQSSMGDEAFLDAISAPGREGMVRRRRKARKAKGNEVVDVEDGDETA